MFKASALTWQGVDRARLVVLFAVCFSELINLATLIIYIQ